MFYVFSTIQPTFIIHVTIIMTLIMLLPWLAHRVFVLFYVLFMFFFSSPQSNHFFSFYPGDFDNVITVAGTEDFPIHLAQLKYFGVNSKIYFLPKYLRGF